MECTSQHHSILHHTPTHTHTHTHTHTLHTPVHPPIFPVAPSGLDMKPMVSQGLSGSSTNTHNVKDLRTDPNSNTLNYIHMNSLGVVMKIHMTMHYAQTSPRQPQLTHIHGCLRMPSISNLFFASVFSKF